MLGMLEEVHVRDLALIEDVWLEFGAGLTVLSGETGAGKTALVGALKLLLGERADSTIVRSGSRETIVEGRFRLADEELLVRRRLSSDGRSRCTLGEEMATVSTLAERLGPLVDLHGQHDHQALLSPATHGRLLDRYVGRAATDALERYRSALAAHSQALSRLEELRAVLSEAVRDADYLRFVVNEIDAVGPGPGEDERLERRLPTLRHAERLSRAAVEAFSALRGDGGAADAVSVALAALSKAADLDPALDDIAARLSAAQADLDSLGVDVRDYGNAIEHDPRALDDLQSRLAALAGLKKKYGPDLESVRLARDDAASRLAAFESGDSALEQAERDVEAAASELRERGAELDGVRRSAGPAFQTALTSAAEDLAMSGARFEVAFADVPFESWGPNGTPKVEFLYAAAPAESARPLAKVASGGEISRVMLALKSVLGEADTTPILVFDEIDAGIGGSTATAVGRRLAELARTHQVLVVTHLAQVAVFAEHHLVVSRDLEGERAATSVVPVSGEARIREVSRMLSGAETEVARAHALELLAGAAAGREDPPA